MGSVLRLESDFTDYYDGYFSNNASSVYKRLQNNGKTRADQLNYLKSIGIKTVDFGPYSKMCSKRDSKFVVYTDPYLHEFAGKHIYSEGEVKNFYKNYLLAEFLSSSNGYTVKYLQIGERRFRMWMYNPDFMSTLVEGTCVAMEELPRQYNYLIGLPIFSIDYVSNGIEMVAIDFNEVQNLQKLGIHTFMSPEEVVREVENALMTYNKL